MLDNRMYWVYTRTFLTRDTVRINRVIHSLFVRGDCRSWHKQCDCFLFGSLSLHRWQSKGMTTRLIFHLFVILQSNLNFPSLSEVKISSVLTNQGKGQGRLQLRCVWAVFNIWDHVVFFPRRWMFLSTWNSSSGFKSLTATLLLFLPTWYGCPPLTWASPYQKPHPSLDDNCVCKWGLSQGCLYSVV